MLRYFTYRRAALAVKKAWQQIRFKAGRGYWLSGNPPKPKPAEFTMFDSVDVNQIPLNAAAVAGYVNGRYRTWGAICESFPHAKHLSIAVTAEADADCLDIENGDATNSQAAAWVKRQLARGINQPVVYTSLSNSEALRVALEQAGIRVLRPRLRPWLKPQVKRWTAHYSYVAHRCTSACGYGFKGKADATQYSNKADGKNLDASLCAPDFL